MCICVCARVVCVCVCVCACMGVRLLMCVRRLCFLFLRFTLHIIAGFTELIGSLERSLEIFIYFNSEIDY